MTKKVTESKKLAPRPKEGGLYVDGERIEHTKEADVGPDPKRVAERAARKEVNDG